LEKSKIEHDEAMEKLQRALERKRNALIVKFLEDLEETDDKIEDIIAKRAK